MKVIEYLDHLGNIIGKDYDNGLIVYFIDNKEHWEYHGVHIKCINNIEDAFKYLNLKAFW